MSFACSLCWLEWMVGHGFRNAHYGSLLDGGTLHVLHRTSAAMRRQRSKGGYASENVGSRCTSCMGEVLIAAVGCLVALQLLGNGHTINFHGMPLRRLISSFSFYWRGSLLHFEEDPRLTKYLPTMNVTSSQMLTFHFSSIVVSPLRTKSTSKSHLSLRCGSSYEID